MKLFLWHTTAAGMLYHACVASMGL